MLHRDNTTKTWQNLIALEPRLLALYLEARDVRPPDDPTAPFCANTVWFGWGARDGGFKRRLSALVGWKAPRRRDDRLYTNAAYEVAYRTIYAALPACRRGCACLWVDGQGGAA